MASQKVTLDVEGMSCSHCSGMVHRTLEEIDGISKILVDLDTKKAIFTVDTSTNIDLAIEKINDAGYKASKTY